MEKSVYERTFDNLVKLGIIDKYGSLRFKEFVKLKSSGYMDLNIDHLSNQDDVDSIVISLAHNYNQGGDVLADPDMEIRILRDMKMVEALTYQQDSMGIYQQIYHEDGKYYPHLEHELNKFLDYWLKNLIEQGFRNR